ncbi:MAG: MazG nucleotide pyrophosphohydrolase domain-containing protein [Promethearchaeota archaeon]
MKISEFQNLIKELYLLRDKNRGIKGTFLWLIEEIGELAQVLKSEKVDKKHVSEELADVIAWTSSLANLLNINLEHALSNKYPDICIKCRSNPCICKE